MAAAIVAVDIIAYMVAVEVRLRYLLRHPRGEEMGLWRRRPKPPPDLGDYYIKVFHNPGAIYQYIAVIGKKPLGINPIYAKSIKGSTETSVRKQAEREAARMAKQDRINSGWREIT